MPTFFGRIKKKMKIAGVVLAGGTLKQYRFPLTNAYLLILIILKIGLDIKINLWIQINNMEMGRK
jgi:hypothetical protein